SSIDMRSRSGGVGSFLRGSSSSGSIGPSSHSLCAAADHTRGARPVASLGDPEMSALPASMTAIEIKPFGGPEVLTPRKGPVPWPAAGEVLVKVAAAGVNRPDVLQRQGGYAPPPGASDIPGLEIAGTVVALGNGATGWKIGDSLCALVAGGGYAEYCSVPV